MKHYCAHVEGASYQKQQNLEHKAKVFDRYPFKTVIERVFRLALHINRVDLKRLLFVGVRLFSKGQLSK